MINYNIMRDIGARAARHRPAQPFNLCVLGPSRNDSSSREGVAARARRDHAALYPRLAPSSAESLSNRLIISIITIDPIVLQALGFKWWRQI